MTPTGAQSHQGAVPPISDRPFALSFRTLIADGPNAGLLPAAFKVPWRPGGRSLGSYREQHSLLVLERQLRVGELAALVVARGAGDSTAAGEMSAVIAHAYGATGALAHGVQEILGELHEAGVLSAGEQDEVLAEIRRFAAADGLLDDTIADAAVGSLVPSPDAKGGAG